MSKFDKKGIIRFFKFSLVGSSGVVVNAGMLWLLVHVVNFPLYLASFLAIETSILSNYMLNDHWTWRSKHNIQFFVRLLTYNLVTTFNSIFINISMLLLLKEWFDVPYMFTNLIGISIGCGMVVNYLFNSQWTYGDLKIAFPKNVWIITGVSLAFRIIPGAILLFTLSGFLL